MDQLEFYFLSYDNTFNGILKTIRTMEDFEKSKLFESTINRYLINDHKLNFHKIYRQEKNNVSSMEWQLSWNEKKRFAIRRATIHEDREDIWRDFDYFKKNLLTDHESLLETLILLFGRMQ